MAALQGTLEDMSMVHLVQVLTISKKSGTLVLQNDGVKATLFVQDGAIVYSAILLALTGEALLEGVEAFYTVMHWRKARFYFDQKAASLPKYPTAMNADSHELIMEGLRRLDEAEKPGRAVDVNSWVMFDPQGPPGGMGQFADNELVRQLLVLVARGVHRVGALAEESSLGQLLTLMTVAEMVDGGLLRVEVPAQQSPFPDKERSASAA